jgi:site-specific DNA-methyltransferase (adenine-specific)
MPTLPENSVDSIITDPPYGLDFMGKSWDHGVPGIEFWQAALRVAKPGAILMAFGGTRTFHRLACAIEDAGWEIRDCMMWIYGSGFPKSLDISKAIDKAAGAERTMRVDERWVERYPNGPGGNLAPTSFALPRISGHPIMTSNPISDKAQQWNGYGTALKPAWEPIIVAMKPLEGTYAENAQKWGVAGLNIDGGRISLLDGEVTGVPIHQKAGIKGSGGWKNTSPAGTGSVTDDWKKGRWPANLVLDEEAAEFLDEQSGESKSCPDNRDEDSSTGNTGIYRTGWKRKPNGCNDSGGASRFFYTSKASSSERNAGLEDCEPERDADRIKDDGVGGDNPRNRSNNAKQNFHPTVKPLDLMRYLCKLTRTPTGGVVLDPFMGSGTTGIAALLEHRDFIGIEIDEKYTEIARKRIADMEGPLFAVTPEVKHGNSYLYN